jgi:hypothetical protein
MRRRWPGFGILAGAIVAVAGLAAQTGAPRPGVPFPPPRAVAPPGDLEWTFARVRYRAWPELEARYLRNYGSQPWLIDGPVAEQNLARRIRTVTRIVVHDPIVLRLEDPELMNHPWIYFVEPGTLRLSDAEVPILREFLLRGGTAVFDDFHGPIEWANLQRELARVFPEREIVDLEPPHPVFNCFYQLEAYPQIPGLGSFLFGRTWEKGGFVPKLRAVVDDAGRAMALINWNTDMADGWEWSNAEDYPGYIRSTADSYRMMINEIMYSLTH